MSTVTVPGVRPRSRSSAAPRGRRTTWPGPATEHERSAGVSGSSGGRVARSCATYLFCRVLEPGLAEGEGEADHPVVDRGDAVEREELVGRCGRLLGHAQQLGHLDRRGERGVLDQRDQGVGQRRDRRCGSPAAGRPGAASWRSPCRRSRRPPTGPCGTERIAERMTSAAYPPTLRREGEDGRGEGVEPHPERGQAVVDDEQLEQQRRAADQRDVEPRERRRRRAPATAASGRRPSASDQPEDEADERSAGSSPSPWPRSSGPSESRISCQVDRVVARPAPRLPASRRRRLRSTSPRSSPACRRP